MRYFATFIAISITVFLQAGTLDEANKLIEDKNYSEAISILEPYVDSVNDLSALYNLGIAYHYNGYHSKAIWAFEKVLKQDPKDENASIQVTACRKELDEHSEWQPINGNFASSVYSFSSSNWSYITIVLAIISAITLYFWLNRTDDRKKLFGAGFTGSILLMIISITAAYYSYQHETSRFCIAVNESYRFELKNDSYEQSEMIILEGSRFHIIHEVDSSYFEVKNNENEHFFVRQGDFKSF